MSIIAAIMLLSGICYAQVDISTYTLVVDTQTWQYVYLDNDAECFHFWVKQTVGITDCINESNTAYIKGRWEICRKCLAERLYRIVPTYKSVPRTLSEYETVKSSKTYRVIKSSAAIIADK